MWKYNAIIGIRPQAFKFPRAEDILHIHKAARNRISSRSVSLSFYDIATPIFSKLNNYRAILDIIAQCTQ